MFTYRIIAISDTIAGVARARIESPQYGHPAHADVAQGYGPCRLCLHTFEEGSERRLLFTYDPFEELGRFPFRARFTSTSQPALAIPKMMDSPTICGLSPSLSMGTAEVAGSRRKSTLPMVTWSQ